jgi:hypothetical protein
MENLYLTKENIQGQNPEKIEGAATNVASVRYNPETGNYQIKLSGYEKPTEATYEELLGIGLDMKITPQMRHTPDKYDPPVAANVKFYDRDSNVEYASRVLGISPELISKEGAKKSLVQNNTDLLKGADGKLNEAGQLLVHAIDHAQELFILDPKPVLNGPVQSFYLDVYPKKGYQKGITSPIVSVPMPVQYWEEIEQAWLTAPQMFLYEALDTVLSQQRSASIDGLTAESYGRLAEIELGGN